MVKYNAVFGSCLAGAGLWSALNIVFMSYSVQFFVLITLSCFEPDFLSVIWPELGIL